MDRFIFRLFLIIGFTAMSAGIVFAEEEPYPIQLQTIEDNKKCYVCHSELDMKEHVMKDGTVRMLFVDQVVFSGSTHHEQVCTACHEDINMVPHGPEEKTVKCTHCHYMDNTFGAPTSEGDVDRYEKYRKSVHKRELDAGNPDAPDCFDCHGTHDIIVPTAEKSRINRRNIPATCGRCHIDEYADYKMSVHGQALARGELEVAVCIDCHGEHGVAEVHGSDSNVAAATLPETCAQCHAEEKLMSRFGIESAQYDTYRESYHGKANKFGLQTVANCASCHGFHDVLPADDPKSHINPDNLAATCGKCHTGANINYTRGKMHVEAADPSSGIIFIVAFMFKILTIGTVVSLVIHICLDLIRRFLNWRRRDAH